MTHTLIYSPEGEPVEVVTSLVSDLVLNKGWTQTAPTFEAAVAAEPKPDAPDDWREEGIPAGEEPAEDDEVAVVKAPKR